MSEFDPEYGEYVARVGRTAAIVVAAAGITVGGLWAAQRRLIYLPHGEVGPLPGPSWESVSLTTDDGLVLDAWLRPAGDGSPVVVVFPGNAGNRADRAPLAEALGEQGLTVLLVDYRGYGGNDGSPSEDGLGHDARAAADYLDAAGLGDGGVVYFGESLGAAVAVELATTTPPDALILRSPFTSLSDAAAFHYPFLPVRWLLRDRYPSLELAPGIDTPVLVVAGESDATIPMSQSRRLAEAFGGGGARLVVIEGADHNDAELVHGGPLIDAVMGFLGDVLD